VHIPDAYLSPATCAALGAAMVPVWAVAARRVRAEGAARGARPAHAVRPEAALRRAQRAQDGVPALSHVDLHVKPGESVAFIGPIGSGESTLPKLVNGIVLPDAGRCFLAGEEVTRGRLRDEGFARRVHQRVGFLFQNADAQLFCPEVRDEIAFGP